MYPFPRLLPFDAGRRARARSGSPVVRRHYRTDALRTSEPSMCEERRHVLEGIQDLKMFYDQGLVETHGTIPALRKSIHGILRPGRRLLPVTRAALIDPIRALLRVALHYQANARNGSSRELP